MAKKNSPSQAAPAGIDDVNARVAALLQDLAVAQTSEHRRWAYRHAAAAVLALDEPLDALVQRGVLRKIPNVGPSSTRVVFEVLRDGQSATVERTVASSGRSAEVERSRALRENFLSRARVAAVLRDRPDEGPHVRDCRGDLQMHSVWSDGAETLDGLIQGLVDRGYDYSAVTDHSVGLAIAHGMSMADVRRQHREIDALNARYAGRFRLLKGIEANIAPEGHLDLTPAELSEVEVVVAAPHSKLRLTDDQTPRMLAAISTPGVRILGHPRGRKYGSRAGVIADWPVIFREAARRRVAIEIDGDPSRQDLDFTLARQAVQAGCLFALDSDAHRIEEFRYIETAVAHARLAGIPRARNVNCWNLDALLAWTGKRS